MSEQALYWFASINPKALTHAEFRVLNRLAWHHNEEEGCAWPSYKYLIEKTGISRGGLSKCMDSMERKGIIRREKRSESSTLYYMNFDYDYEDGVRSVNHTRSLSEPEGVHSVDHNKDSIKKDLFNNPEISDSTQQQKRACQLPDGWVPNDKNHEDAAKLGMSQQEIDHEADQFRDYHTARGSKFKDWNAAWRTWCRNGRKFSAGRKTSTSHTTMDLIAIAARARPAQGSVDF